MSRCGHHYPLLGCETCLNGLELHHEELARENEALARERDQAVAALETRRTAQATHTCANCERLERARARLEEGLGRTARIASGTQKEALRQRDEARGVARYYYAAVFGGPFPPDLLFDAAPHLPWLSDGEQSRDS